MSFTREDFRGLSPDRRLKKALYALRQWERGEKSRAYWEEIMSWFEDHSYIGLLGTDDPGELKELLEKKLRELNPFLEERPFDGEGQRKTLPLTLLLEDIRSPHNVGSIFRSAEALGVKEVILGGITAALTHPRAQKASRGALVAHRSEGDAQRVVEEYRERGHQIYALEKHRFSVPLESFVPRFPCLLILGNEEFGVSVPLLKLSDASLAISLHGAKNSLNVAVAAGIALGHFCRGLNV